MKNPIVTNTFSQLQKLMENVLLKLFHIKIIRLSIKNVRNLDYKRILIGFLETLYRAKCLKNSEQALLTQYKDTMDFNRLLGALAKFETLKNRNKIQADV